MFLCLFFVFVCSGTVYAKLEGNCDLEEVSDLEWITQFNNQEVNDNETKEFKQFKSKNVTKVETMSNDYSKYFSVSYKEDVVTISPSEEFQNIEMDLNSNTSPLLLVAQLKFTCTNGTGILSFYQPIKDLNTYAPHFGKGLYSYTLPMPLPSNFDMSCLFKEHIEVCDEDITNTRLTFAINPSEDFSIEWEATTDNSNKCHKAVVRTKKGLSLNSSKDYTLMATDVGTPTKSGEAQLSIKVNTEESIPANPQFKTAYYTATYINDKESHTVNFDSAITVELNQDKTTYSLAGDYADKFQLQSTGDGVTVTLKDNLPDEVLRDNVIVLLTLEARIENAAGPGRTALVIYLPKREVTTPEPMTCPEPVMTTKCPPCSTEPPCATTTECPACPTVACPVCPTVECTTPVTECAPCTTEATDARTCPPCLNTTCPECPDVYSTPPEFPITPYTPCPTISSPECPTTCETPPECPVTVCTTPAAIECPTTCPPPPECPVCTTTAAIECPITCPVLPECPACTTPAVVECPTTCETPPECPVTECTTPAAIECPTTCPSQPQCPVCTTPAAVECPTTCETPPECPVAECTTPAAIECPTTHECPVCTTLASPECPVTCETPPECPVTECTVPPDPTEVTPTVTFESRAYIYAVPVEATTIGVVRAKSNIKEKVEYGLKALEGPIPDQVEIGKSSGNITLREHLNIGEYKFQATAKGVLSAAMGFADIVINVVADEPDAYSVVVEEIDELTETLINLPCAQTEAACNYEFDYQYPETDPPLFTVVNGSLRSSEISLQLDEIKNLLVPQFTVNLKLHQSSPTSKNATVVRALQGPRQWVLLPTRFERQPDALLVSVIINDINNNPPVFTDGQKLLVGYPVKKLLRQLSPQYLAKVKATDLDFAPINSDVRYFTQSSNFIVHPISGVIYPGDDAFDDDKSRTFEVIARDRAGGEDGLSATLEIEVVPLEKDHLTLLKVENKVLEDVDEIIEALSANSKMKIRYLTASTDPLPFSFTRAFKNFMSKTTKAEPDHSLSIVIYAFGSDNEVIHTDKVQSNLEGTEDIDVDSWNPTTDNDNDDTDNEDVDTTGFIAAIAVLGTLLVLLIIGIGLLYYFKFRKYVNPSKPYNNMNEEDTVSTRSVQEGNPIEDASQRRPTGYVYNAPPPEYDSNPIDQSSRYVDILEPPREWGDYSKTSKEELESANKESAPYLNSDSDDSDDLKNPKQSVSFKPTVQKINIVVDEEKQDNESERL